MTDERVLQKADLMEIQAKEVQDELQKKKKVADGENDQIKDKVKIELDEIIRKLHEAKMQGKTYIVFEVKDYLYFDTIEKLLSNGYNIKEHSKVLHDEDGDEYGRTVSYLISCREGKGIMITNYDRYLKY